MKYLNLLKCPIGLYYLIFGIGFLVFALNNPRLNWDMIPYVASAKQIDVSGFETVHREIYRDLEVDYGKEVKDKLTNSEYRKLMADDSDLFEAQLPFYRIRLIYIYSIFGLNYLGMNVFFASYFISATAMLLSLFIFFLIIARRTSHKFQILFPLLFCLLGGFKLACFSTPDAMAFLVVVVCIFLFFEGKFKALWILLPVTVLIRTDLILFIGLISLVLFAKDRRLLSISISLFFSLAFYFWITKYTSYYGWSIVLRTTFLEKIIDPRSFTPQISVSDYFRILYVGLKSALQFPFFVFLATSISGLALIRNLTKEQKILLSPLIILPISYVLLHFFLFPIIWTRFFSAFYLLSLIGLMVVWDDLEEPTKLTCTLSPSFSEVICLSKRQSHTKV